MNVFSVIAYFIAFLGSGMSAYFDMKTTYIPDLITHSMIGLGVVLLFLRFQFLNALIYLGIGILIFVLGFLAYTFGQIGGGDVKLYTALALLVPTFEPLLTNSIQPPYPPIVSIFFMSALLGTFFISSKYAFRVFKDRTRVPGFNKKAIAGTFFFLAVLGIAVIWSQVELGITILFLPVALGMAVLPFKDDLIQLYVVKEKDVDELTEDDIILVERMDQKLKKALGLGLRKTLLNFELEELKNKAKKAKIKRVPVAENLPTFGIYIFLATLFTLLFGDFMFFLFDLV